MLGTLYVAERTAHDRTEQQLSTQRAQLDSVRQELDSTKGKLTAAEQDSREQESRASDLESRNAELQKCVDATGEFFAAVQADDQARGEQAFTAMLQAC